VKKGPDEERDAAALHAGDEEGLHGHHEEPVTRGVSHAEGPGRMYRGENAPLVYAQRGFADSEA
jgi:hypothetical protein